MGIKDFSKTFLPTRTVKLKDLKGKTIAIDAMTELYRAALGAKSVALLTDKDGNPTIHISVILANIIDMQVNGINQIWVFDHDNNADYNTEFHNPAKLEELAKRRKKRTDAKERLNIVKEEPIPLFSDSEEEEEENKKRQDIQNKLEKQIFSLDVRMINDIKLILNCLHIPYIEAPAGFEGEHIASWLSFTDKVDGVYSGDTDPIPFGAKVLYRRHPRDKKIYEYTQQDIIEQIWDIDDEYDEKPTIDDIRLACAILGSDFSKRTKGIGSKTVLHKMYDVELEPDQENAIAEFAKIPEESSVLINNADSVPFIKCDVQLLIDWIVEERSFTKSRVENWLSKIIDLTTGNLLTDDQTKKKIIKKSSKKILVKPTMRMPLKKGQRKKSPEK